jgi:MoaD family protein
MKMIDVNVKFYGSLRNVVNEKNQQITLHHCDLEDLIGELIQQYGEKLKEKFIDPKTNQFNERALVFVNGLSIKSLQGTKTELKEGDTIAIFPPSGGG